MNPFSGFLTPQVHPIILPDMGAIADRRERQREFDAENAARQDSSRRDWKRISLQEEAQKRAYAHEDQQEVEGLLGEYQQAVAKGDATAIGNAIQKLKRFGLDVSQSGEPPPNLRDFNGSQVKPSLAHPGGQQSLATKAAGTPEPTAPSPETIARVASGPPPLATDVLQKPPANLRDFNGGSDDLSEDDFIAQMEKEARAYLDRIAPSGPEEQSRDLGDVDSPEFQASAAEEQQPVDMGDVDSPQFKADAAKEQPIDLGDVDSPEFQKSAQAEQGPPPLATDVLRKPALTRISKGDKVLYEGSGNPGSLSSSVANVFDSFISDDSPEMSAAAKRAKGLAAKLVQVDGVSAKDAIDFAMKRMEGELQRANLLQRSTISAQARARHGGGAGTGGPSFNIKGRQPYMSAMDSTVQKFKNENVESGIRGYQSALDAINSDNPATQRDAIQQLISARSGKTVSDRERAVYNQAAGLWETIKNRVNFAAGQTLSPEYRMQMRALIQDALASVAEYREQRAKAAEQYHRSKLHGAPSDIVENDSRAVGDAIRMGSDATGTDNDEDLLQ